MASDPINEHLTRILRYVVMAGKVGIDTDALNYYATAVPPKPSKRVLAHNWYAEVNLDVFWRTREGDSVVGYLSEVGWIKRGLRGTWVASYLAEQLVRELDLEQAPEDEVPEAAAVVMRPDDPMRYQLLAQVLAGADLLVDPYFKAAQVDWLSEGTSIRRVLISASGAKSMPRNAPKGTDPNRVHIEMELGRLQSADRPFPEVRVSDSDSLHDRAVVYGDRPTALLGTSLSGVATHLSVCTPLPQLASDAYTPQLESLWAEATILVPRDGFEPPAPAETESTDSGDLPESES